MNSWNALRRGRALRVEVEPYALANRDEDAIVEAVEFEAITGDFDIVHVTGSMLFAPPPGTTRLLRRIGDTAHRHGKRLDVGPL
jgi:hypothetical protein